MIIATDASYHPTYKKSGYAYVIQQGNSRYEDYGAFKRTPSDPIEAEIKAIEYALRRVLKKDLRDSNVVVQTDCKFAIHSINHSTDPRHRGVQKLWKRVQRRTGATCRFIYVKAHSGHTLNDWCDKYAKKAMWEQVNLVGAL